MCGIYIAPIHEFHGLLFKAQYCSHAVYNDEWWLVMRL